MPGEKTDVKVSKKAEGKKGIDAGNVSLAPVEATEVTDDEIAAAKKYAEEDAGARRLAFPLMSTHWPKRQPSAAMTP